MKCPHCKGQIDKVVSTCPHCKRQIKEDTLILTSDDLLEEEVEIKPRKLKKPLLAIKKGPFKGTKFTLKRQEVLVGRDPGSDIFLDDITVSRRHAKIQLKGARATIVDLDSLNGTYVNGKRIDDEIPLDSGDEIQIGKFKLIFFYPEAK
jgi:pSer/pThr/pTyr-binding forkhead associated (FHA) protein